jgi:hypothetical protein
MKPKGSLPCSQEPVTRLCPEPAYELWSFSLCSLLYLLKKITGQWNCYIQHAWEVGNIKGVLKCVCWKPERLSIVKRLRAGRPEFGFWQMQLFSLFTASSRLVVGPTQLPIQCIPGVKQLRCEAAIRNAWSYTSTHPHVFMTWCLIKGGVTLPSLWPALQEECRSIGNVVRKFRSAVGTWCLVVPVAVSCRVLCI